jgi:hypothetical protein
MKYTVAGTYIFLWIGGGDSVPEIGQNVSMYHANGSVTNHPTGGGSENIGTHSLNTPDIIVNP